MPPTVPQNKASAPPAAAKAGSPRFKFKLLVGQHVCADPAWVRPLNDAGRPDPKAKAPSKTYTAGSGDDLIETDTDLVKKFGAEKFRLVSGGRTKTVPASMAEVMGKEVVNDHPATARAASPEDFAEVPADDDDPDGHEAGDDAGVPKSKDLDKDYGPLDSMTLRDLKNVADSEGIDLDGAHTKAEVLAAIRKTAGK